MMSATSDTTNTARAKSRTGAELTPFRAALSALRAVERKMRELDAADNAAREAADSIERTDIPVPACLIWNMPPIKLDLGGGKVRTSESTNYTFRTANAIEATDSVPPDRKAQMLEALEQYKAAQKAADDECGYTQAEAAAAAAHEAFMASYHAVLDAVAAVMRTPTRDPADIKVKRSLLKRYGDCEEDVVTFLRAMVDSLLDDAPPPASPTPPPTFGGSLFEDAAAKVRAERQWLRDNPAADTPDSYFDAVNDLLMTPAPNLFALAYKLGVFSLDAGIITGAKHFFDEISGVFPPEDPEAEEDNDGSARQLRAIYQDVIALAGAQPGIYGADRAMWEANRQAYLDAKRTWDACDHAEDEKADSPLWTAYAEALEIFQATPPPTVLAMVEQMRAEFEWGGPLARSFQTADCPYSMRDLLDGGDAAEIFTARYYMHALRLARVPSGALQTPASEALQPGFDFSRDFDEVDTLVADWKQHHAEVEFYPGRATRLSRVYSSERSPIGGDDAELVGMLPRWLELERKRDLLIGFSTGGDLGFSPSVRSEFDALTAECERLFERSRELRASGPDGLRAKALLLLDWLPSSDFLGYDETIAQLSRSLVADVLSLPAIDMSAAEWDAWRRASGTSYSSGDERDHQALVAEIEAAAASAQRVPA